MVRDTARFFEILASTYGPGEHMVQDHMVLDH